MKKVIYSLFSTLLLACSSSGKYEKAIADYIQTDSKGTWTDMKVEFQNLEVKDITVQDSIDILQQTFEADRKEKIEKIEKSINYWRSLITEDEKDIAEKALNSSRKAKLKEYEMALENAQKWTPSYMTRYENVSDKTDVLIQLVSCTYSFIPPVVNRTQIKTSEFVFTPDGNKCIGINRKPSKK